MIAAPVAMTISAYTSVKLTLLDNAGVMIESKGVRIYVDPVLLPEEYENKPADVVCVTHPHGDHYSILDINKIQIEDTINIFPANMSDALTLFDGVGVNPEVEVVISDTLTITAFYMYTFSLEGYDATHPAENNWTSYIIDINGFVIFHAGDSKNIPEYEQLTGRIDVAMLPLGPGCQTMFEMEVVDAINTIQPDYMVPLHFQEPANDIFYNTYGVLFQATTYVGLDHFRLY
jgi:L-ascorbate metabolism protein UlaG (beta-lactamase superfamily)